MKTFRQQKALLVDEIWQLKPKLRAANARVEVLEGELETSRMEAINLRLELDEEKRSRENVDRCLRETQKLRLEDVDRITELEADAEQLRSWIIEGRKVGGVRVAKLMYAWANGATDQSEESKPDQNCKLIFPHNTPVQPVVEVLTKSGNWFRMRSDALSNGHEWRPCPVHLTDQSEESKS